MRWGDSMRPSLEFEELNKALLAEFPYLLKEFPEKVGPDPDPGQYVVFGSVFNYHIERSFHDPREAQHIGEFIERMAAEGDGRTEDLLKIEIVPTLLTSQDVLNHYWPFLGTHTRRLLAEWASSIAPGIEIPR